MIEYKKKHRPMEVKLIDESIKSFIVDDSQSVRKISDKLGEHLDLGKDAEQFCLCWPGSTIKKRTFYQKILHHSFFFYYSYNRRWIILLLLYLTLLFCLFSQNSFSFFFTYFLLALWLEENLTLHEQPDPSAPKAKVIDEKTLNKNVSKKYSFLSCLMKSLFLFFSFHSPRKQLDPFVFILFSLWINFFLEIMITLLPKSKLLSLKHLRALYYYGSVIMLMILIFQN